MVRLTIEKFMAARGEYWTNVYHFPGSDLAAAITAGQAIANWEMAMVGTGIIVTKIRADDKTIETDVFQTVMMNEPGDRAMGDADTLPLYVALVVDFGVGAGGRPCRKFLRGFSKADLSGMSWMPGLIGLASTYAAGVVSKGICDPQGNIVTSGSIKLNAGMRQLRRGSKKRSPHYPLE